MLPHADVGKYQFTRWPGGPLKGGEGFRERWFTVTVDASPRPLFLHNLGSCVLLEMLQRVDVCRTVRLFGFPQVELRVLLLGGGFCRLSLLPLAAEEFCSAVVNRSSAMNGPKSV